MRKIQHKRKWKTYMIDIQQYNNQAYRTNRLTMNILYFSAKL
jgi:hypothetical protein